jgi:hypothetical protein
MKLRPQENSGDRNEECGATQRALASPWLHTLLRGAIALLSVLFLLLFLYAALRRLRYPFELEWLESGVLLSVRRILAGQGLYVAPSTDFVPYLYAPLYFYLVATVAKLTSVSYVALRAVSIVGTLGCCGLIYAFIACETRRRLAAIAGAGLFLACYPLVGNFYDIGRVDSLYVFFLLLALFCARRGHPVLAALACVLCFQTKQSSLIVAIVLLSADWQHRRRIVVGLGTFAAVLGASLLWMNRATEGWYSFYLFHVAGGFKTVWREVFLYLPQDVLAPMGIALLLGLAAWAFTGVALRSRAASFYVAVTIALYASVGYIGAHAGSSANTYMPVYAWTAILFAVAFARLLTHLEQSGGVRAALATTLVLAAAATQLALLLYNPGRYLPTPTVREARQRFIDQIRSMPGDVYIFSHGYDAVLAGKLPHAEFTPIDNLLTKPNTAVAKTLRAEFDDALRSHRYSAVVVDGPLSDDTYGIQRAYPFALSAESEEERFLTSQPTWILLPCSTAESIASIAMRDDTSVRSEKCSVARP